MEESSSPSLLARLMGREDEELRYRLAKAERELERLRESAARKEALHEALLEGLAEGVVLLDSERVVRRHNAAAVRLLGTGSRVAEGSTLLYLFREPETLAAIDRIYAGEESEWLLNRPPRILRLRGFPFTFPGQAPGALLTVHDVTRQETLETTRQKFISNVSHELKTPVAGIRLAAENLQLGNMVSAEGEQSLGSILRASERMSLLLQDVAELSRIETGALKLEPMEIEVEGFARQLVSDFALPARSRRMKLEVEVGEGVPGLRIKADPLRLHQLLDNLISNALKFSPEGSTVRLSLVREGAWLAWSVQDQGPGIALNEQGRIFERFWRSERMRGVPGTGLGLSIVKHLARLMDGEVTVESEFGQGAVFTVRLPIP
ncbi:MAG TPA: HAMP domain-containing sensor histidine kinase [Holophagaceae bacterium]|nr:HAMP domain-containing sensor histidine kinase [Holophagaceae bacterium]